MENNLNSNFKVLLIYPNTMMATLLPLSICVLSSCLKEKKIEVELFDSTFYKTEDVSFEQRKVDLLMFKPFNYQAQGIKLKTTDICEDLKKKVRDFKPDLIGITIVEDTYDLAIRLLEGLREFDIPVIAGGVFVTLSPETVIANPDIDMVCVGEGEEALVELCERMSKGKDYSDIKNIWVKYNKKGLVRNPFRPLVDLNSLPYINYEVFEKERLYRPMFGKVYTMIHVEIDRGCPNNCTYCCASHIRKLFQGHGLGVYYRSKKISRLIDELGYLIKKYKPDYINFNSETFLAKPVSELKKFANWYKEIRIPFWCQTRPETLTDEKVKLLKELNCNCMQFGIEQGNEEFRKKMLRRYGSNEQMLKGIKIVEKYQIPYTVNNIIGFPDETRELIFDTINFNRQINARTINCNILAPYKNTDIYNFCIEKGYLKKGAKVHQVIDGAPLEMDSITYEELKGLQRTFSLYCKFPESEWGDIRIAERFDHEGNQMFEKLKKIYQEKFFNAYSAH